VVVVVVVVVFVVVGGVGGGGDSSSSSSSSGSNLMLFSMLYDGITRIGKKQAGAPAEVAKAISAALTSRYPATRYVGE